MIVNKRLVEDDENVLARKVFVTLVKLYPRGYSILNDGNFVKKIYAASDEEAIRQFNELATKGKLLTESVKKAVKEQIVEAKHQTLVESVMSDLDLEVKEAGGKEAWIANVDEQIDDLSHYLNYLKKSAYNEVNRGGNFESTDEVDEAIRNCEKQLGLLKSKKQIIEERKDESVNKDNHVDEALHIYPSLAIDEFETFKRLCDKIGLKTLADVERFMKENGEGKDVITALKDYLINELGIDFQAKNESKDSYDDKINLHLNNLNESATAEGNIVVTEKPYYVLMQYINGNEVYYNHRYGQIGNSSYPSFEMNDNYKYESEEEALKDLKMANNVYHNYLLTYQYADEYSLDDLFVNKIDGEKHNINFKSNNVSGRYYDIDDMKDFEGVVDDGLIMKNIKITKSRVKNSKNKSLNGDLDFHAKYESLKEDLAVAVNDKEIPVDAEKQPIEEIQEKISIEQVLSDLIKDEFEAIDGYNSSIATLKILEDDGSDYSGIIANLEDIKNEELIHVGQLQKCLAEVNPEAEAIDDGNEEASETIAAAEEESAKGEEPIVEA